MLTIGPRTLISSPYYELSDVNGNPNPNANANANAKPRTNSLQNNN